MSKGQSDFNVLHIIRSRNERAILMVCIGIAFVFWLALKMSNTYDTSLTIPIAFVPPTKDLILKQPPPSQLKATLSGNGWDLLAQYIWRRSPALSYQLTDEATQVFRLQQFSQDVQSKLGEHISIKTLVPEYVSIQLDAKARRRVPIELAQNISIASQFIQTAPTNVQPDTIWAEGPASVLRNITQWQTLPLALNDICQRTTNTIGIKPYPNRQVVFEPSAITYDLIIEQITEKQMSIPISVIGAPDSLWYYPHDLKVSCTIGLSDYDRLHPTDIQLLVDASELPPLPQSNLLPIQVQRVPSFVNSVHLEIDSVRYLIIEK